MSLPNNVPSITIGVLIGLSFVLFLAAFVVGKKERRRRRKQDHDRQTFNKYTPIGIIQWIFGRAGLEITVAQTFLMYAGAFLVSYLVIQWLGFLIPAIARPFVLLVATGSIPILIGYALSIHKRLALRDALIEWMSDAASESAVERNFYRLLERVHEKTSNKHLKHELDIIFRDAQAEKKNIVEVMHKRANLWNMETYRMLAVFTEVLMESGGSVRDGYHAIRDQLDRQMLRENQIKSKTMVNRYGSMFLVLVFIVALSYGYLKFKDVLTSDPSMKLQYYGLWIDSLLTLGWVFWYTKRNPQ